MGFTAWTGNFDDSAASKAAAWPWRLILLLAAVACLVLIVVGVSQHQTAAVLPVIPTALLALWLASSAPKRHR